MGGVIVEGGILNAQKRVSQSLGGVQQGERVSILGSTEKVT